MANPFQQALEAEYLDNPESNANPFSSPFAQAATDPAFKEEMDEEQEGFWKSSLRTTMQPIQGFLETTGPGLAASFWQMLSMGELDHEEMDHLKQVYEKEGKEFPEEEFEEAREKAMSMIPTVRNLATMIEEKTGLPLEPKTRLQKGIRFATEAARLSPEGATLRPLNVGLPKPVLGAGVEVVKEVLQEAGLPEPAAEVLSFLALKMPPEGSPRITVGGKEKPSGLKERGFEGLKEERKVSQKKMGKIDRAIENDFKTIADDLIKNSPVGKTHAELEANPLFKSEIGKQFGKIEELADAIPDQFDTMTVKKAIAKQAKKNISTNLAPSEYAKEYHSFMKQFIEETPTGKAGAGDLVRSYRGNNQDLTGAYDPLKSKNFNRAKKDALLDYNRAIAEVIQEKFPGTEFSKIFPETNKGWSQILDAEKINEFINDMFKGEIKHNKIREFFDNPHTNAPFKRALGDNYPKFEQLMKDMLSSEKSYKMLKVAKDKGLNDFVETASLFVINPKLSMGKKALDFSKQGVRFVLNTVLDKPKLTIKWHDGVKNLMKGDFKAAEKDFAFLKAQAEEMPKAKESVKPSEVFNEKKHKENVAANQAKVNKTFFEEPETINVKGEKVKPESSQEKFDKKLTELKESQPPVESKKPEGERRLLEIKTKKEEVKQSSKNLTEADRVPDEFRNISYNLPKTEKKRSGLAKKIEKETTPKKNARFEKENKDRTKRQEEAKKELKEAKEILNPKPDTPKKVDAKIEHAAEKPDITKKGLKTQKAFILDRIEDALANPSKYGEKIDLNVPGDGQFKIHNDKKALEQFKKKIISAWPDKPLTEAYLKKIRR